MNRPKVPRLIKSIALNTSVNSTGSYLVPLDYGSGLYACHLELTETTVNGGSLDSPNFNIRPNNADTPITWNSKSDSGPTTTTVSTSTSTPTLVITRVAISTITTPAAISSSATVKSATPTDTGSPLPSSASTQSQGNHLSVGIIVGASIAGLIGVVSLIVAILLYVRTRSTRKREALQPPQNKAPNRGGRNQSYPELTGSSMAVESGGREIVNRDMSGYPIAVSNHLAVGELEGRI